MYCHATRPERAPRVIAHSEDFGLQLVLRIIEAEMLCIALDHREIGLLVASMKAEPETEAIGERDLFLDRLARIDRAGALVFDHIARQKMPPVRGGVERDIVRPALDTAIEHRFQRFVAGVFTVERQVVAEKQAAALRIAQQREEPGKARNILAMDLDED